MSDQRQSNRERFPEFSQFYDRLSGSFEAHGMKVVVKRVEEGDQSIGRPTQLLDEYPLGDGWLPVKAIRLG